MFGFLKENSDKINLNNYTITTIVGNDTVVEGTIITKASVRIDGTLIGGVSAEGVVILSKNGKIKGNIMAENIVVAGVVEGNMQIRENSTWNRPARSTNREVPVNGGRGKRKAAKSEKIVSASEAAAAAMGRIEQGVPAQEDLNADQEISLNHASAPLDDEDIDFVEV